MNYISDGDVIDITGSLFVLNKHCFLSRTELSHAGIMFLHYVSKINFKVRFVYHPVLKIIYGRNFAQKVCSQMLPCFLSSHLK